jgi:two-component system sensor histidine kinase YesM
LKKALNPKAFKRLNDIPIRNRLILILLLVSVIPVVLMGTISYNVSRNAISSKIENYSRRELTQTVNNLDSMLKKYIDLSLPFISDANLRNMAVQLSGDIPQEDRLQYTNKVRSYLMSSLTSDTGLNIVFFPANDKQYVYYGTSVYLDEFKGSRLLNDTIKSGTAVWDYYEKNIVFIRPLKNPDDGKYFGTIATFVDGKSLDAVINATLYKDANFSLEKITDFPYSMLVDQEGAILLSPFQDDTGKNISTNVKNPKFMEQILSSNSDNAKLDEKIKGRDVMVTSTSTENNGWHLLDIAPDSYLYAETNMLGLTSLLIGVIISAIVVLISFIVAFSISNPIKKVMHAMQQAEGGDLSVMSILRAGMNLDSLAIVSI